MTGDWLPTTLGALIDATGGELQTGPFGSQLHAHDYVIGGEVAVVPTSAIGRGRLIPEEVQRISRQKADELARHYLRAGDIVFARRGVQAAGLSALVRQPEDGWLCGTGGIRLRLPAWKVDSAFLSFALSTRAAYDWIRQHAVGATMPNLNEEVVRGVPVALPPLDEQRRIAAILGALDDKIELNRKMNRTLEEMAQALFKSWFIDFDGHDDLVDSEIGPTPRGWMIKPIGNVAQIVGGSTPSTAEPTYWNDGVHSWATPKDLSGLSVPVLLSTERRITDAGLQKIGSGLLPAGTFLLSSRAPIGYTAISQIPTAINQGFIAIPPGGELPASYLLFWTHFNMDIIKGRAGGTTFAEISKAAFRPIPVVIPPKDRLQKFEQVVSPILQRIAANARESRTLATLRDTLLPKLISGELRVPEAEDLVHASTDPASPRTVRPALHP